MDKAKQTDRHAGGDHHLLVAADLKVSITLKLKSVLLAWALVMGAVSLPA